MSEKLVNVIIHHGGKFERHSGAPRYTGDGLEVYRRQDPDKLSHIVILRLIEEAGYQDVKRIFYKNVFGDYTLLSGDASSRDMIAFLQNNQDLHIYVEHRDPHTYLEKQVKQAHYNIYEVKFGDGDTYTPTQREIQRMLKNNEFMK